jgi:hypothetical protein
MGDNYIPARDGQALTWMQTFATGIAAAPATYQLTTAAAASISSAVDAYATAYAESQDPALRTTVIVATKDETRNTAEQLCRQYAILIKFNAGISDADKIAIGVRPVNPSRVPIGVPASSPLVSVIGATPGSQTLRFADTATPDKAAKPFGAVTLLLFVAIGEEATSDPAAGRYVGSFTKNPVGVGFDAADAGKVATYFARWQSRRGEVGPWSGAVSMRIVA